MELAIKIGGSILFNGNEMNTNLIEKWFEFIHELLEKKFKLAVVVGGGLIARQYINAARKLGLNEFVCDLLGIFVSRINAKLLLYSYIERIKREGNKNKYRIFPQLVESSNQAYEVIQNYDLFFAGGLYPGQSTMGVAAEVAEAIGAKYLFVATNVDGIYDKDPKKFKDAKKLSKVSISTLLKMFVNNPNLAGTYALFDQQSLAILNRSKITTIIFNGRKLLFIKENIINCLEEQKIECFSKIGSVVYFDS